MDSFLILGCRAVHWLASMDLDHEGSPSESAIEFHEPMGEWPGKEKPSML